MDSIIDSRIFHINLFIILTFFIDNSILGKASLSDIKLMCSISNGESIKHIPQNTPCKTIVWYSTNAPKQEDIDALNKTLKRAVIYDDNFYTDYRTELENDYNIQALVADLCNMIDDKRLDILIFDRMYMPYPYFLGDSKGYENYIQFGVHYIFSQLKTYKPNILYGLMLRGYPDPGFNLTYLNEVVPFFVYPGCNYAPCDYHDDQSQMPYRDPALQVENSVKDLISKLSCNKICLMIQIVVQSLKPKHKSQKQDSYTTFCESKPNKNRRFCLDTLPNFYEKGKLIPKYNLAGSIISGYDKDDFGCKCGCGCYAATSAINAGVHCLPKSKFTECTSWTLMYKDRNNP